jgi:long-chain acyl-CoA synthetase
LTWQRVGCHHRAPWTCKTDFVNEHQQTAASAPPAWYEENRVLLRVVADLAAQELSLGRPGRERRPLPWTADLDLARDLGADSLDMLGLATALAEMLHLHRSGREERLLAQATLGDWLAACRDSLRHFSGEITFRTSGSSGSPKRCTHSIAALWQEVGELAGLLPGRRRIVSAVPAHHIYGFLFTVLLPHALGIDSADVIDVRDRSPAGLATQLRPGDLVIGHPEFWRALAHLAPQLAPGITGVTSTSPCPDEVADALRAAGLDTLLQVYGSSETGGVGWRDAAHADYRLFSYWTRVGDEAQLERLLGDGRRLRYPLQDKLAWSAPDLFRPSGRIDHAVQVGGTNVFPAYVADVLAMHSGVREVAVRLMRSDEGNRLKAFIVPQEGDRVDLDRMRAALTDWVRERLTVPERPTVFSFGGQLPRKADGKPTDWIIDAWP